MIATLSGALRRVGLPFRKESTIEHSEPRIEPQPEPWTRERVFTEFAEACGVAPTTLADAEAFATSEAVAGRWCGRLREHKTPSGSRYERYCAPMWSNAIVFFDGQLWRLELESKAAATRYAAARDDVAGDFASESSLGPARIAAEALRARVTRATSLLDAIVRLDFERQIASLRDELDALPDQPHVGVFATIEVPAIERRSGRLFREPDAHDNAQKIAERQRIRAQAQADRPSASGPIREGIRKLESAIAEWDRAHPMLATAFAEEAAAGV